MALITASELMRRLNTILERINSITKTNSPNITQAVETFELVQAEDPAINFMNAARISLDSSKEHIKLYAIEDDTIATLKVHQDVTHIGEYSDDMGVCAGLDKLAVVMLPDGLKTIGGYAFEGCTSLNNITIPNEVKQLGYGAFRDCTALQKINIPAYLENWDFYTFQGCTALSEVSFGHLDLGILPPGTFYECSSLQLTELPYIFTHIGDYAFVRSGITDLTTYAYNIGQRAFADCDKLKNLTIDLYYPEDRENFAIASSGILENCLAIENLTLPLIGSNSTTAKPLAYLFSTTNYTAEDNATVVPATLKNLTLISVDSLSARALSNCNLEGVKLSAPTEDGIISLGNYCFENDANLVGLIVDTGKITTFPIGCFVDCSKLNYVDLTNASEIKSAAFSGCLALESISLGSSLAAVSGNPFSRCGNLKRITVDSSNTAFKSEDNCLIETATGRLIRGYTQNIPAGVTELEYNAFDCLEFTEFYLPNSITKISNSCFDNTPVATIYYDDTLANWNAITKDAYWQGSNNPLIVCTDGAIYSDATEVSTTAITSSNRTLAGYTGAENEELVIPAYITDENGVTYNVTSISATAFRDCDNLKTITIPDSVTTFGYQAFYGCDNLTTINMPSAMTDIEAFAFEKCISLTNIEIPSGISTIKSSLFLDCASLNSITIPSSVMTIKGSAFDNCTALATINYKASMSMWGSITKESGWDTDLPEDYAIICKDGTVLKGDTSVTETISSGTYVFKDAPTLSIETIQELAFKDGNNLTSNYLVVSSANAKIEYYNITSNTSRLAYSVGTGWTDTLRKIVKITSDQVVPRDFYNWFMANATKQPATHTLSAGTYVFDDAPAISNISTSISQNMLFTNSGSMSLKNIAIDSTGIDYTATADYSGTAYSASSGWTDTAHKTITLANSQEVSTEFYYWFNENATKQSSSGGDLGGGGILTPPGSDITPGIK